MYDHQTITYLKQYQNNTNPLAYSPVCIVAKNPCYFYFLNTV